MRLSVVFELLLIFLIIAFAAYGRVVPENKDVWRTSLNSVKEHLKHMGQARQAASAPAPPNRYCACSNLMCNCCRDFSLPVVPIQGPGCASLKYLKGDQMAVTMSFGDKVLRNTTISGRKPKPVCMNLPGGISKFCGRVYGISRDGDQFKACLGLELRALDDVEAALRVSCFRFGPQGMKVEPAQPLPATASLQGEDEDDEDEDDDDDDDDDDYGLGDGEEEEEDDDDAAEEESENDVESSGSDYTGFSALSTDFLDSLFGGGGAAATEEEDAAAAETVKPSTAKPATAPYKTKATTPSPTSQLTEKQASAESVTSTSYTVSVVQDNTAASAEASTVTALDDTPTDRVETVPTPSQSAASTSATDTKDKDYDDDDDDDDDDDNDDDEDGDIVSDIIESAADVVGMSDAKKNSTGTTKAAAAVTEAATSPTTSDAAVAATTNNAPSGKDTEDDDDESEEDDDDDDDEDDKFKRSFGQQQQLMPVAIVPNDRRGRTHRRMRLSVADADETAIHFMKKV